MKLSGAQILVKLLERQGVEILYGIPGGANLPIYDALYDSAIRHVLARHEQGAGFMAQGMARTTSLPAVCLATSGPGATNLITAIADAKLDSIPVVFITGQVPSDFIGTDAFQEVDFYGLTVPITKHNFLVQEASDLLTVIPEAFRIAQSGRPGPVAVDIPKDVQTGMVAIDTWPAPGGPLSPPACHEPAVGRMADMIHRAKRPILVAGGGIIAAGAADLLKALAEKNNIPVTATLMGMGVMAVDHPLFLGMLGMHGNVYTNRVMAEADLIVGLGIRFDDRATGKIEAFCRQATVIHVDVDHSEIDKLKNATLGICGDVKQLLTGLLPEICPDRREKWLASIDGLRCTFPVVSYEMADMRHPAGIIAHIGNKAPGDAIVSTDVGQHQMWAAQVYPINRPRSFLTSGGLGTMGFGLPAAIGAAFAHPDKKVICISGDGSLLMNIQEMATMAEHGLNITVVVMNNGHLGLVRQQQELFYNNRIMASKFDLSPNFAAIARGFGISAWDLSEATDRKTCIEAALAHDGPCLLHAPVYDNINVFPMVPPGASNLEMIGGDGHA